MLEHSPLHWDLQRKLLLELSQWSPDKWTSRACFWKNRFWNSQERNIGEIWDSLEQSPPVPIKRLWKSTPPLCPWKKALVQTTKDALKMIIYGALATRQARFLLVQHDILCISTENSPIELLMGHHLKTSQLGTMEAGYNGFYLKSWKSQGLPHKVQTLDGLLYRHHMDQLCGHTDTLNSSNGIF